MSTQPHCLFSADDGWPVMLIVSQAGFLALLFIYIQSYSLTIHAFAAPVSVARENSLVSHGNADLVHLGEHPHYHIRRDAVKFHHARRALASNDAQVQILIRRKSVFTKIKEGFKKAGNAIKKGFQKIGNGIKNVAKKIGNGIKTVAKKIGNGIKTAAKKVGNGIKTVAKKIGNGIKTAAKKVGNGIKTAAKKVGNGIKTAAKKVWNGVKTAAKKVGKGIKIAAKKVGTFVKKTGAKIAKFGLKVISTVASVGARLANFIPGIGKPISRALKLGSKATEAASNAIHANLGRKLEKGMSVMNRIEHPLSGVGGAVLDNILRR